MADTVTCIQQIVMNLNWYCLNPPELKYKLVKILLPIVSVCVVCMYLRLQLTIHESAGHKKERGLPKAS